MADGELFGSGGDLLVVKVVSVVPFRHAITDLDWTKVLIDFTIPHSGE